MKITRENFKDFIKFDNLFSKEDYVNSLLDDIDEMNRIIKSSNFVRKPELYIDIQLYHDEYSPERTDPCPDFYGFLSLKGVIPEENSFVKTLGDPKETLKEIDYDMFLVSSVLSFIEVEEI